MFSFKRVYVILSARNKEFYRDPGAIGWTFFFPLLVVFGFSYMFQVDAGDSYKVAVFGSKSDVKKSEFFSYVFYQDLDKAKSRLVNHQVDLLLLPNSKREANYFFNEKSPRSKLARKVYLANKLESENDAFFEKGEAIHGSYISYVEWLFPGLLAMNVMWMALWGLGWVIVRQRRFGVLKRLKASPLTAFEYLLAQMFSRMLILSLTGALVYGGCHLIYPF